MGSRVRIQLFHILHFVRDLLFPLLKNSKSGVDDWGHRLRITHTHRRQKLTTDFFKRFEFTILVVTISISRKKICLLWFLGGHFLRGLITKS